MDLFRISWSRIQHLLTPPGTPLAGWRPCTWTSGHYPRDLQISTPSKLVWAIIRSRVGDKEFESMEGLEASILETWDQEIIPEYMAMLALTMTNRIQAIIDVDGTQT